MTALFAGPVYSQQDIRVLMVVGGVTLLCITFGSVIYAAGLDRPKPPAPAPATDVRALADAQRALDDHNLSVADLADLEFEALILDDIDHIDELAAGGGDR